MANIVTTTATSVVNLPGAFVRWLDGLSARTKALLAGGGASVITGSAQTVLMAMVAFTGIGIMPPETEIQRSIVELILCLGLGFGVSTAPNAIASTPTKETEVVVTPEVDVIEENTEGT